MILISRDIYVSNNKASLNQAIYLYRGDGDIILELSIYSVLKDKDIRVGIISKENLITENIVYGSVCVYKPDKTIAFVAGGAVIEGKLNAILEKAIMDETIEVGEHLLQVHLYDSNNNRMTIPIVPLNIEEPICGNANNITPARADYTVTNFSVAANNELEDFTGEYESYNWTPGEYITADKLNNMIAGINEALNKIPEIDLSNYQTKQDDNLTTEDKTIVGAINELDMKSIEFVDFDGDSNVDISIGDDGTNENMAYLDLIKNNCETEVLINFGEDGGSRAAISTFSGWGIPFRKENMPQQNISGYSTCVTVYDNATNKNIMRNVELDLYLLSKSTLETERFSVVRKLASSVLTEPGEVKFDFTMAYEDWPDIFAMFVCNTQGYNLLLNMGSFNSNYKDNDIRCVYATSKYNVPSTILNSSSNGYVATSHKFYGGLEFKPELKLESIPTQIYKNTTWDLPTHIYAVEDDTLEMFTTGMINSNIPYDYHMRWTGGIGSLYTRKYMYTPTSANLGKTYSIRCELRDHANFLQDVHNMTVHVEPKPSNPSSMKTLMLLGDSLTSAGVWPHELYRRLVGTDGDPTGLGLTNLQTIGRLVVDKEDVVVKYEGYGGWTYEHYYGNLERLKQYWITTETTKPIAYQKSVWKDGNNNNWILETIEEGRMKFYRQNSSAVYILPESGNLVWVSGGDNSDNTNIIYTQTAPESGNPFWDNENNELNVQKYVESQGASTIDYMICLLGWNQITNVYNVTQATINFVNAMHEQMPNMKIILCGLQVPNPDGCGANYGLGGGSGYSNPVELRRQVAQYNDVLEQLSIENDFVYFVHVSSQFDYEYGSIMQNMEISKRCPTKVQQCVNGIHPSPTGVLQIADAIYRRFVAILNEDNN